MGIHDREYYQDEEPRGFRVSGGGQRMLVTNLVLLTIGIYLVDAFTPARSFEVDANGGVQVIPDDQVQGPMRDFARVHSRVISDLFTLRTNVIWVPPAARDEATAESVPADYRQWRPWNAWQLLTYGFVHAPLGSRSGIFHIGLNMFALWMFGRDIELRYGRKEFLRFYLFAIVLAGLAYLLIQAFVLRRPGGVLGASGGVVAVVILFVLRNPKQTLHLYGVFPIPAWLVGVLIVGLDLMRAFGPGSEVAWQSHLAGAAFALAYFKFNWNLGGLFPGSRTASRPAKPAKRKRGLFRRKPNLKLHDPEQHYADLDREADIVLEKLHRDGEDSLSARERRVLEAYSRRMRQKHR